MNIDDVAEHLQRFALAGVQNVVFLHGMHDFTSLTSKISIDYHLLSTTEDKVDTLAIQYMLEYKKSSQPIFYCLDDVHGDNLNAIELLLSQLHSKTHSPHALLILIFNPEPQIQKRFKNALHLNYTHKQTLQNPLINLRERLLKIFLSAQSDKISKDDVIAWVLSDLLTLKKTTLLQNNLEIIDDLIKIADVVIDASPCEKFIKWSLFRYMQQIKDAEKSQPSAPS